MSDRIGVVGGGLAGITAALRCADAGHDVLLLESRQGLGGLTHSFRRGDLDVDNGQHVFLRCCTSYRGLLERLGVADHVTLQDRLDIQVVDPTRGTTSRLRRTDLPAPLHLAGSLLRFAPLSPSERVRAARAALALRRVDLADTRLDDESFGGWLVTHGQNQRSIDALWDLFGVATLNARAVDCSLAQAAMVFQTGLLAEPSAGDVGWPLIPLQRLHGDAASMALVAAGATVLTKAKVARLHERGDGWAIEERDGAVHEVDRVVLAVPPDQAERLLPDGAVDQPAGWAERLGTSPIVNAHVVFDRRVLDEPLVAGVGSAAQWVFDRTQQSRLQQGQYLAVSISAADAYIDLATAEIREAVLTAIRDLLPRSRNTEVRDFFVTRERFATFRPAPGSRRYRLGPTTRRPGLVLAGAWTDTGWPATMEGAVRSGDAAAAALDVVLGGTGPKGELAA